MSRQDASAFTAETGEDRLAFVGGRDHDISSQELADALSALADEELDGVTAGTIVDLAPD